MGTTLTIRMINKMETGSGIGIEMGFVHVKGMEIGGTIKPYGISLQ